MTDSGNDEELILAYQTQLKHVEDTLLRQEQEEGIASVELRQLRSDLREALSLFETSDSSNNAQTKTNVESEPPVCLTLSSDSESSDDDDDDEEEEDNALVGEIAGTNCSVEMSCPVSGQRRHNAVVLGIESLPDNSVRVLMCQPTRRDLKPCTHFLNDTCRFGDNCKYSHGFVVSVNDLLEYIEPNYESLATGQRVLCRQGTDELWKPGVIESVESDNHLCVVRFTHFNALEAIPFESIITMGSVEQNQSDNEEEYPIDNDSVQIEDIPSSSTDRPRLANMGDWEKHTRGIGSKLLSKMGYKAGQGLGRRNQGLVNPIEARLIPKGKSLDAILELQKKNKLPDAFKIKKRSRKTAGEQKKKSEKLKHQLADQQNVFTFLDKVFTSEIRSATQDSTPSPLDRFKDPQTTTVDESSLLLHAQIGRRDDELRAIEREISHIQERLKHNESNRNATALVVNLKHRLAAKKNQYMKLKKVENDLISQREQTRKKKSDIF